MHSKRFKYPRTKHLPWSLGVSNDDVKLASTEAFKSLEVVVTEKLDGENTTLYPDYLHARSLEATFHPSRSWVKALHASICHLIPREWRICGENLFAQHSIPYKDLSSYFYIFSVWNENNICLSWDETHEWAQLLGVPTPQVFYRGAWDENKIKAISTDPITCEGYVVRPAQEFQFEHFEKWVAKFVRRAHVEEGSQHWMHKELVQNKLKK
ncbi:RNA ligase family protein [Parachlamydia acanthamoebae]|jgi:hypothetical protein|uniref:RNA ligase family protein n=1 Tax=Parachlamydia acanthamoebae TaxID=83552 RepID=UPI0001C1780B|nr:RNA ligase family protein [Parachlamydia acanthamoebae]EFB42779.1 hypothetical protein pah_c002o013 [Parachlamydia acanthamoebae str. Hall's coccus]